MFPTTDGLKQGDALSHLLSNFRLEYVIMNIHANQEGFQLNGAQELY